MKLIKHLFGFVLMLVLLVGLLVGGLVALTYDGTPAPLVNSEEIDLSVEISDDFKSSLKEISNTEYKDNKLTIDLSMEQLNGILADTIRAKVNPNYQLEGGDDFILKQSGMCLESIYFTEDEGILSAKVHFNAFGFYKTTVSLSGEVKAEDDALTIAFDEFKLGKHLGIKRGLALSLLQKLNLELAEVNGFNPATMSLEIPLRTLLASELQNNSFLSILLDCNISAGIKSSFVYLSIDTTKLFNKGVDLPEPTMIDINEKLAAGTITPEHTINISLLEGEINKLIIEAMSDKLYEDSLTIGNNIFSLRLEGLYYNIKESKLISNLFIDDVKTSVTIDASSSVIDNNGSKAISIKPIKTMLGGLDALDISELVPEIIIDESLIGLNTKNTIKDIIIDREGGKLDFVIQATI